MTESLLVNLEEGVEDITTEGLALLEQLHDLDGQYLRFYLKPETKKLVTVFKISRPAPAKIELPHLMGKECLDLLTHSTAVAIWRLLDLGIIADSQMKADYFKRLFAEYRLYTKRVDLNFKQHIERDKQQAFSLTIKGWRRSQRAWGMVALVEVLECEQNKFFEANMAFFAPFPDGVSPTSNGA